MQNKNRFLSIYSSYWVYYKCGARSVTREPPDPAEMLKSNRWDVQNKHLWALLRDHLRSSFLTTLELESCQTDVQVYSQWWGKTLYFPFSPSSGKLCIPGQHLRWQAQTLPSKLARTEELQACSGCSRLCCDMQLQTTAAADSHRSRKEKITAPEPC